MKRRVLLIVGIMGVVAVIGCALFLLLDSSPSKPVPNPNGYDDLVNAGNIVAGAVSDFRDMDHERLRTLVVSNTNALKLARVGLSRSCAVPTDLEIATFANWSANLIALRKLAMVFAAEGRLAQIEDQPDDAARSYLDAIRVGNEMSRGGTVMDRLVGIACEGIGSRALIGLLPKLACQQMQTLAADLQKIDQATVPWSEVLECENRFARAEFRKSPNPVRLITEFSQARDVRKSSKQHHDSAAAHIRLLEVELALRSYYCREHKSPKNLGQLVPQYLVQLPSDPFSDTPLIYRPDGTNWLVYSVGPDRVDDGGKPVQKSADPVLSIVAGNGGAKPTGGDILLNSPW